MPDRFTLEDIGGIAIRIRDKGTVLTGERICEVLNELYDENLALKSSNMEYEDELARLEKKIKELECKLQFKKDLQNNKFIELTR